MIHLDEGNLAGAGIALQVADGDLAVVFQVALLAEDIMDTGHHFVPLVVISKPARADRIQISAFLHSSVTIKLRLIITLPFQNDINHSCWQNLKRFTPEFIFPPLVCLVKPNKVNRAFNTEKLNSAMNVINNRRGKAQPCQKVKWSESA